VVQDALYQVYFPDFLDLLTRRAATAYRALARRLAATCAALTAAAVAGEVVLLPTLVPLVFGADFAGAEWPMAIMTLTFFFIAGCHPWLWALYVGAGRLGGYTAMAFAAVAVQYLAMLAGFRWIGPTAAVGMMGMLASYVWLIPATYLLARRRWPRFLPGASPGSAVASGAGDGRP
jgi:O-antigen/teichoic acid export membrane protein